MNSWNRSTSYANCIKLHHVNKPEDIDNDTWWEMLWITEWQWQAGINGRSGGYVVLYRGGIKPSGYKSYCTHCGQKNYQAVADGEIGICGRCDAKARVNFKQTDMQIFTWPGKDVDMHEDFEDWTLSDLRKRVELIQDFDKLCDSITATYISLCQDYRVTEEEIFVPKTIKVLEPVA